MKQKHLALIVLLLFGAFLSFSMSSIVFTVFLLVALCVVCYVITIKLYQDTSYYQVTHNSYFNMKTDSGKYGEYLLFRELSAFETEGCYLLFNIYIPGKRENTAEIDVILISNKGIVVFESKNYSGWIFGTETQKQWTQTFPVRRGRAPKEHFYNPIMQNKTHVQCLKSVLGEQIPIWSVVAFSDKCELRNISLPKGEAYVVNYYDVHHVVSELLEPFPCIMSNDKTFELYEKLYNYSQVDEAVKVKHIHDIQNRFHRSIVPKTTLDGRKDNSTSEMESKVIDEPTNTELKNCDCEEAIASVNEQENKLQENVQLCSENESIPIKEDHNVYIKELQICPRCGNQLIKRVARRGENAGREFYGCSNYPKCKYTIGINDLN